MPFDLASEYTEPALERSLLASLTRDPEAVWGLSLPAGLFAVEAARYKALRGAVEAETAPPDVPPEWTPARDVEAVAERLKDLWKRRRLAELQQNIAALLPRDDVPARDVVTALIEEAAEIEAALSADDAGRLAYPSDLLPGVLQRAEEWRDAHLAGGDHVTGVRTGLKALDDILGGLQPGLTILSGGPGMGKTTLALQIGADASAAGVPVLYVTFENSPEGLTLKGTCAAGGLNDKHVKRGRVEVRKVRAAAQKWAERAERLAIVEGRPDLSRGQIRGKARRLMNRFEAPPKAPNCLVIVDYLQLYAKAAKDLRNLGSLRERVEAMGAELRDLGMRLRAPVLALASQHRGAGYGDTDGGGSARMDTLKESGDLEYGADAIAFLTSASDRMATEPARAVDLTVAKNRHGETGKVPLIFRPDLGTMRPEARRAGDGRGGAAPAWPSAGGRPF